ncbi:hypothetical protein BDN72DRAFT_906359 [Pluteus cervinus]|uniref:Uncharacterized protein n=1 Tax=Pluteus cervinus TaxID=181527 RepID=A0ACD2ZZX2_9AGAR|nr:hypothetical protein BDN72DRAFT_906359 [Pluteus cervinus]
MNRSRQNHLTLPSTTVLDHAVSKVVFHTTNVGAIYKVHPIVDTLDPSVQLAGIRYTHCFHTIQPNLSLKLPPAPILTIPTSVPKRSSHPARSGLASPGQTPRPYTYPRGIRQS